ncbi:phospholipase/carboxylesterase [Lipingzhangella halophila]|uniref:Phospholipase/carboxylesterase n=1 Tax=Lipingzhangella halophila TaxID=1783352 RepID=A0A7W7W3B0_9ACTN|nr:alpha/beta hydrolase [Lipingzhangella halophila]MBB4931619.1 phospholipase/carboxylesterase [Lipingzhangella halophila]
MNFEHVFHPASDPAAPTLLLLHGTGADEHDLIGLGRALDPKAALLSPRGKVNENGANRWFRRLREGVYDVDDIIERTHELAGFVEAAADRYRLDRGRLIAVGFSNGANIAAATLLLRPGLLRGAALFAAGAPLQEREPERVDLAGTSVFVSAGEADMMIPIDQARLLATQLTERSADVELREHPGGHALPPAVLGRAREWLSELPVGERD